MPTLCGDRDRRCIFWENSNFHTKSVLRKPEKFYHLRPAVFFGTSSISMNDWYTSDLVSAAIAGKYDILK
jgi:hypothetical protein